MPELQVFEGERRVFTLPFEQDKLSIGRSPQNDLILEGDSVSRQHVVLEKKDGAYFLRDLSSQGTLIDGLLIKETVGMTSGARIGIAQWQLIFNQTSPHQFLEAGERHTQITRHALKYKSDPTKILKFEGADFSCRVLKPLLILDDPQGGKSQYRVRKRVVSVGTAEDNDIVLHDEYVSKKHAEFRLSDLGFHITDLASTNGTFVGNAKIREFFARDNQDIILGKTRITIIFEKDADEELPHFDGESFFGIQGSSKPMKNLFGKISLVARTDMTALIQGETGSGKEMVARAIHDLSERRDKSFVVLNCGAISPNLVESELFGHEKGAFTGADQRRIGAFEQAHGGTIFLDEIGELPLELQSKVLRVLEYQSLRRVGGNQDIRVDVRVVVATHRDLAKMSTLGHFREDLFYRLYVLPLKVPALREHKEDIEILVKSFLERFSAGRRVMVDDDALAVMKNHDWPGNVRELKNTVLRAMAFCRDGRIQKSDIDLIVMPMSRFTDSQAMPQRVVHDGVLNLGAKDDFERDRIAQAIAVAEGDKNRAAQILQMGRSTLFRKIKELGL